MATKTIHLLVDDLDGKELKDGEGQSITFTVDGVDYLIDLSQSNADKLEQALAPYVSAARRVGGRRTRPLTANASIDKSQLANVRSWAKSQGLTVSDRGRISQDVQDAYQAAH